MNIRFIVYILGWILNFQGLFLLVPSVLSVFLKERVGYAYLISSLICLLVGFVLTRWKPKSKSFYAKEGFVTVATGWIVLSISGALPFLISGEIPSIFNALFETISGYTTTGATILTDVEAMSKCGLFWRAFTHWIGGMGVLVFVLSIVPLAGGNNMHMMRAESTGPSVGKLVPRVKTTAFILYAIYTALTLLECILLLFAGMNLFDAVTTSFSTAGTGGFGNLNTSMAGYSMAIQNIVGIFMVLFGVNFSVYFLILVKKPKQAFMCEEARVYFAIIFIATLIIGINIRESFSSIWVAFQQAFFQVGAIITTTGFATCDFNLWPTLSKTILVMLMFVGACAGSTGGGIKVSRFVIAFKNVKNEIGTFIHPKSIRNIRFEGKKVNGDLVRSINTYLVIYMVIFVVSWLIISLENYSFETSFTAIAAILNNVGPGLDAVGPVENFSHFNPFSKCVLMFDMLAGRLELMPMLILFTPSIWKKSHR